MTPRELPLQLLRRSALAVATVALVTSAPAPAGDAPIVALSDELIPHDDPESTRQRAPAVGVTTNGEFLVVWEEGYQSSDTEGPGGGAFVNSRRYTPEGVPVGGEMQLNTYTLHSQEDPAVSVHTDGSFQVVWRTRGFVGELGTYNIMGRAFEADGSPVGVDFLVNTYNGRHGNPDIDHLPDGRFVVVWQGATNTAYDRSEIEMRLCTAGCPGSTAHPQVNTYTTSTQTRARVAVGSDGSFVVVWSSYTDSYANATIRARRFDSSGTALDPSDWVVNTSTGYVLWPDVGILSNGDFLVVWQSNEHPDVESSDVLLRGRRFRTDGTAVGGDFAVSTPHSGRQRYGRVLPSDDGRFLVAWENGGIPDVAGRVFRDDGVPIGSELVLNQNTDFNQERPAVAFSPSLSVLGLAWQSNEIDNSRDIRARALALGVHPDLVFGDGFESGSTSSWSTE